MASKLSAITERPLAHLSKTSGIGGTIKSSPEDFIVEEIGSDGKIYSVSETPENPSDLPKDVTNGRFVHFILQKTDWSTNSAVSEISKRLHI